MSNTAQLPSKPAQVDCRSWAGRLERKAKSSLQLCQNGLNLKKVPHAEGAVPQKFICVSKLTGHHFPGWV